MAAGCGGMWKGAAFTNDIGQKHNFCIVWGKVVKEPQTQIFNKKRIMFTLKWHTKQYLQVVLWGDSEASDIASTLEVGDVILCCGTIVTTKYTLRKGEHAGEEKEWFELNPQIIIPMASIVFLNQLFGSNSINKILQDEFNSKPADALESLEDFNETQADTNEEQYEVFEVPDDLDCPF